MMKRVAVLGAGIMGSSTALFLARRGVAVTLYDAAPAPFCGASRWNEGKIHLGFLYSGDPSFQTAERLLPAGLVFKPLVEDLLGQSIAPAITADDDVFLVHRHSVATPESTCAYFERLAARVRSAAGADQYLADASNAAVRRLSPGELEEIADVEHVSAGFTVPERSVSTRWVADAFHAALDAESRVECVTGTQVLSVRAAAGNLQAPLMVQTSDGIDGPFDYVVNALWAHRLAIDRQLGLQPAAPWSHRYRLCLFVRTSRPVDARSAVVCTGPFGDVKAYGPQNFYLSWYPAGLIASGEDIDPPALPPLDSARKSTIIRETFSGLGGILKSIRHIEASAQDVTVEGGWVFAIGQGLLSDAESRLHRRHDIGIHRRDAYFSVDTGKYSVGPWLARQVADQILRD